MTLNLIRETFEKNKSINLNTTLCNISQCENFQEKEKGTEHKIEKYTVKCKFSILMGLLPDEVYKLIYVFAFDRNGACSEANYGRCLAFTYTIERMDMYHFRNVLVNDYLNSLPTSRGHFMLTLAINTVPLDAFYDVIDEYVFIDGLADSLVVQHQIMLEILRVTRPRLLRLQRFEKCNVFPNIKRLVYH